jgi:spermidine synthase
LNVGEKTPFMRPTTNELSSWIELARAFTPEGDELILRRRADEFEIRFNGWELMSSRAFVSEAALARLACEELGRAPRRILIGGLGMGCTLRSTLDAVDASARVVVAELVPAVVEWVKGPLAGLARRPLDDPRVDIRVGSVVNVLAASGNCFDMALLDTDNGPEAVMHEANRVLYSRAGLEMAKNAMSANGVIGFWAADRSARFEQALAAAGMRWRRVDIDARGGGGGPEHSIYLARPL